MNQLKGDKMKIYFGFNLQIRALFQQVAQKYESFTNVNHF